jgi:hypothetical protein
VKPNINEEIRDAVKLPSQTVFMPIGNEETLLALAYKLRQADLYLIAPQCLQVPLRVETQWVDVNSLEEHRLGDVTYWVGLPRFANR